MKSLVLESPEATIRFHDLAGVGTPLVFVHGLGCASSCDYSAVARDPFLASRRAILVDLLGSGFSDRPEGFDYSVSGHARIVVALIEALGLAKCDLYGHSMGGAVAIVAATMLPGRVEHLVLSEPNLDPGGGVFSRIIAAQTEALYVAIGHAETIREAARSGNPVWAGSMAATAPFAAHRGAVSLVEGASPSWRRQLLALDVPCTVLFGARSLPDPDAESLAASGVGVAVVPGAGHSMAWENPSGLARAIADACSAGEGGAEGRRSGSSTGASLRSPMSLPLDPHAPPDFDFVIGDWRVHHRRLKARLAGCTDWDSFDGLSSTHKTMGGFGNVEDNQIFLPGGSYRAVAVRSYDAQARTWSIWWLDGRSPGALDTPVVGSFSDGVGTFFAEDTLDGLPIRIRFTWCNSAEGNPHWDQAFSSDGGVTWEVNWEMEFVRLDERSAHN